MPHGCTVVGQGNRT